ncbi:prepilin-type N-terminal cleavage/methylation domain-containing protein [Haliangium sp.]|uniref:prepilin-type N-terminal cleavage/methylation domain-containing protein n=1 Tax=Haliangium sp. TaxID=2663208 RepID=UPI003D0CDCEB
MTHPPQPCLPQSSAHRPRYTLGQRGLTLIEVMIVVVIIGVLVGTAAVTISTEPSVEDEARRIAALINEGARKAVSGGSIDVDAIVGNAAGLFRSQISVRQSASGRLFLLVERFEEGTGLYREIYRRNINRGIVVAGFSSQSEINPGTTPTPLPPPPPPPFPVDAVPLASTQCRPDGTCRPWTLYLESADNPGAPGNPRARVVVLALNGMNTQMFSGW